MHIIDVTLELVLARKAIVPTTIAAEMRAWKFLGFLAVLALVMSFEISPRLRDCAAIFLLTVVFAFMVVMSYFMLGTGPVKLLHAKLLRTYSDRFFAPRKAASLGYLFAPIVVLTVGFHRRTWVIAIDTSTLRCAAWMWVQWRREMVDG